MDPCVIWQMWGQNSARICVDSVRNPWGSVKTSKMDISQDRDTSTPHLPCCHSNSNFALYVIYYIYCNVTPSHNRSQKHRTVYKAANTLYSAIHFIPHNYYTLRHYYNSTKGSCHPPYAPGCWKPIELPVRVTSIGNCAVHAYCSWLRYANPLHCLVHDSVYFTLCHYSTVTSFLHVMLLLHSFVITPQLVSLLYVYILEFYLGEPQLELM